MSYWKQTERSRLEQFVSRIRTTFLRRQVWVDPPPSIFLPSHFSLSRRRLISAKRQGKISVLQTWLTSRHHLWQRRRTRWQRLSVGRPRGNFVMGSSTVALRPFVCLCPVFAHTNDAFIGKHQSVLEGRLFFRIETFQPLVQRACTAHRVFG